MSLPEGRVRQQRYATEEEVRMESVGPANDSQGSSEGLKLSSREGPRLDITWRIASYDIGTPTRLCSPNLISRTTE